MACRFRTVPGGGHSAVTVEETDKVAEIIEAAAKADFQDLHVGIGQQPAGFLQPQAVEAAHRRLPQIFLKKAAEIIGSHIKLRGDFIQGNPLLQMVLHVGEHLAQGLQLFFLSGCGERGGQPSERYFQSGSLTVHTAET